MKNENVKSVILGHNSEEGLDKIAPYLKNPQDFLNFSTSLPEIMFGHTNEKKVLQKNLIKVLKK